MAIAGVRPAPAAPCPLPARGEAMAKLITAPGGPARMPPAPVAGRRADLDLLRALVVGGLVLFHSATVFEDVSDFYVKNHPPSLGFAIFVGWAALWGMPLLFVVSGMGVFYAFRTRSAAAFVRERSKRLLVPFVFGMLALVPVQAYCGWRFSHPGDHQSYGAFWVRFFDLRPHLDFPWLWRAAPGNPAFDAGHLYFLYYLFVFSVLLLPVFCFLRGPAGSVLLHAVGSLLARPGAILLLALPVAAVEAALGNQPYGGWNRYAYAIVLLYGFLLAADRGIAEAVRRHRRVALALAVVTTAAGVVWGKVLDDGGVDPLSAGGAGIPWRGLKGAAGWLWVLAILGFAGTIMERNRPRPSRDAAGAEPSMPARSCVPGVASTRPSVRSRVAAYANEAVLPFYVLHETVLVAIAFFVVRWTVGALPKYLAIVTASFLLTLALYEIGVRRTRATRFLFGMKPLPD
jgi:hypothetical protein